MKRENAIRLESSGISSVEGILEASRSQDSEAFRKFLLASRGALNSPEGLNILQNALAALIADSPKTEEEIRKIAFVQDSLGNAYCQQNLHENGIEVYKKAIDWINSLENKNVQDFRMLSFLFKEIGRGFKSLTRWPEAIEAYKQSCVWTQKIENKNDHDFKELRYSFNEMGNSFFELNRFLESIEAYKQSVQWAQKIQSKNEGDFKALSIIFSNLMENFYKLERWAEAIDVGKQCYDLYQKISIKTPADLEDFVFWARYLTSSYSKLNATFEVIDTICFVLILLKEKKAICGIEKTEEYIKKFFEILINCTNSEIADLLKICDWLQAKNVLFKFLEFYFEFYEFLSAVPEVNIRGLNFTVVQNFYEERLKENFSFPNAKKTVELLNLIAYLFSCNVNEPCLWNSISPQIVLNLYCEFFLDQDLRTALGLFCKALNLALCTEKTQALNPDFINNKANLPHDYCREKISQLSEKVLGPMSLSELSFIRVQKLHEEQAKRIHLLEASLAGKEEELTRLREENEQLKNKRERSEEKNGEEKKYQPSESKNSIFAPAKTQNADKLKIKLKRPRSEEKNDAPSLPNNK